MGSGTIPTQFVVLLFSVIFFVPFSVCVSIGVSILFFLSMRNDGYFINNQLVI